MVMADSHGISRAPCYSGPPQRRRPGFAYRTLTVYGRPSQTSSATQTFYHSPPARQNQHKDVPQPRERNTCRFRHAHGLASSPFAHHYSGNHYCFLFLRVLRCFTSPRPHQLPYTFRQRRHPTTSARLPHSETPGSKPGCQLPEEYRRLPRPSSDPDAKASTMRPQQLENTKTQQITEERYSRPLYKTQKTTTPPPTKPHQKRKDQKADGDPEKTQPPKHPHPPNNPNQKKSRKKGKRRNVHAGARFLRTQQRTRTRKPSTNKNCSATTTPLTMRGPDGISTLERR
jgi:hypothetical protein